MWGTLRAREKVKAIILRQIARGPTTLGKLCDGSRRHEVTTEIVQALIATGKITKDAQGWLRVCHPKSL